jgi:hypothetical protein
MTDKYRKLTDLTSRIIELYYALEGGIGTDRAKKFKPTIDEIMDLVRKEYRE